MLVTTKKKIYLCDFGVVDEGVEIDVSQKSLNSLVMKLLMVFQLKLRNQQ